MLRRPLSLAQAYNLAYSIAAASWIYIGCFWASVLGGGNG